MQARALRIGKATQTMIGVGLACAILASWVSLHLYAMFGLRIDATTWPLVPAIAAVQCWLSVGMFIVAHDAMHGSLAPGRPKLNARIGAAMLMIYAGFGWAKMRDAHFAHHRAPGSGDDPDFDADHPNHFWAWYATFLRRYFGWRSGLYIATIVTLYWAVFGVPIANIALLYGPPAIASSLQLFYFGTYRPHRHDDGGFADRHNARSEAFGYLGSLFSCFHFGYHHEHHLSPDVPWWALPSRRRHGGMTKAVA
ncbi:MAG TPA: fatty acid desaturase [Sphingomonas sp.]|jgi:beta-carotene ketolase (CrtW type)